ncbi:MAG: radical SAM protein, partial [Rhodospirillales bacterium]|nr:radical SAM protein [Rhodospirillales bacterium]
MKRNVYLVDLGTASNRNLMPLGVGLISAYASSLPDLASDFDFHIHFLRGSTSEIVSSFDNPYVVGFAMYVWNFKASLRLSAAVKAAYPNAILVSGGYSLPKDPVKIRQFFRDHPQLDILVHGEGEFTFAEVMQALSSGAGLDEVEGISFRTDQREEGFITTGRRERIVDLNDIPSPFLNGTFDKLLQSHKNKITGVVWETNRGCPFSCTFCDWGHADVSKLKRFDEERVYAEIDWISRNDIFYIYLADANFGILYDRDLRIAEKVAAASKANDFPKFMAVTWTKNTTDRIVKIAETFAEGGVMTSVTLAVQSFNQDTLDAIKRKNIKNESLLQLKQEYHDRDLPTYTEMILGLPEETYDTFVSGLDQAMTSRLSDHWVFHLCTLLQNTEMDSDEYRRKYDLESRFVEAAIARRLFKDDVDQDGEIEEIVVGTKAMPCE